MLPEESLRILEPLNPRLVLILVAEPAALRPLELVQLPLLQHCTPPDLHHKSPRPTHALSYSIN